MNVGIVGLGLIGGSMAKSIKARTAHTVWGVDLDGETMTMARMCGAIDAPLTEENLPQCDLILVAIRPGAAIEWVRRHADGIAKSAILVDLCGVKRVVVEGIAPIAEQHGFAYIGGHPMAGSEKTGYESSTDHLLENAYYIITPTAASSDQDVERLVDVANTIGSIPIVLDYHYHDQVTAAISHLPHIVASSLVNLVKDSDGKDGMMKRLAAGGFKDITRIASSSPEMWEQICMTNRQNLAEMLRRYIASLSETLAQIEHANGQAIYQLFDSSRTYRSSFSEKSKGALTPDYSFTVDIVDEVGSISTLSVILASKGISIRNIGINHNREHGEGALRISFYDKDSMEAAWAQLAKYHYELIKNS